MNHITSLYNGELANIAKNIASNDFGKLTNAEKKDVSAAFRSMDDATYHMIGAIKSLKYASEDTLPDDFGRLMRKSKQALQDAEATISLMAYMEDDEDGIHPYNNANYKTDKFVENLDFTLSSEDYGIHFTMNQPLANMKTEGKELLTYKSKLEAALGAWLEHHGSRIERQDNAYMVFVHHYDKNKRYCMRDCDNYYEKPLSDILASNFLRYGDSCHYVQRCSFTKADTSTYTEVFLVRFDAFLPWISTLEMNP